MKKDKLSDVDINDEIPLGEDGQPDVNSIISKLNSDETKKKKKK